MNRRFPVTTGEPGRNNARQAISGDRALGPRSLTGTVPAPGGPEQSGLFRVHGAIREMTSRNDPFEQEAVSRAHSRSAGAVAGLDAGHMARQGPEIAPAVQAPPTGGRPLDPGLRVQMESRLGFDFSGVRVHNDATAAQTNERMGSNAFTMGRHIAFASGKYQPQNAVGRELLTHELTHVVQQRAHRSVQMQKETKGDQVLTTNWDVQFQLNKPSAAEMSADPADVLTPAGLSSLKLVQASFRSNPSLEAELEGNASIEGPPAYNTQLSINRARYLARLIGVGRVTNVPGRKHDCTQVEDGMFGCGTMHAHPTIDPGDRRVNLSMFTPPTATGRPPGPIGGPPVDTKKPEDTTKGSDTKKPDDATKTDTTQKDKPTGTGGSPTSTPTKWETQWSGGVSGGVTGHQYLTPSGPNDPASEAVVQLIGAYTRQHHAFNKPGVELAVPVQLQVSLKTGVVSVAGGGQLSYVIPFGKEKGDWTLFQWSAFTQILVGEAVDFRGGVSGSTQLQPSVGTQILVQPKKWLQLGAQATAGVTVQTGGPASVDYGGAVIIQFVH